MKILIVSEFTGLGSTGYSNYYKEICTALHKEGHEVIELASYGDNSNPAHLRYQKMCPWKVILNIPAQNANDMALYEKREQTHGDGKFGAWAFDIIAAQEQPDLVIAVRDHWYDKFIIDSPAAKYYNTILSPTVDSMPQKGDWLDTYQRAEFITTYNEWSQNWLKQQYKCTNMVEYISPSAADEFRILNKDKCREKLGIPKDIKLIGTVMRNQRRKRFPELFKALEQCPDMYLYCHTAYPDKGWDIPNLLLYSNIQNRVFITYMCEKCPYYGAMLYSTRTPICPKCKRKMGTTSARKGLSNDAMAEIYGSMDLYVQPHNSEGLGIPVLEASKCGIRCISTDYSAQEDVIRKCNGIPMKYLTLERELETNCLRAVIDVNELARLINDPSSYDYKREDIQAAYSANYSWDKTTKKWIDLVSKVKPKGLWDSPPDIKQPMSYKDVMSLNSDNHEFLLTCILYVACDPSLLGSYLHTDALDNLNAGNMMVSRDDGFVMAIDRKFIYNKFRAIRENINEWENQKREIRKNFLKNSE